MLENRKTQYTENAIQKAYIALLLADSNRHIFYKAEDNVSALHL